uniref:Reverse transcriptase domain-containing protein n=1 Tax=Trichuris muris TaxID=70415 RepID=A0A5S6QUG1_TRIMR
MFDSVAKAWTAAWKWANGNAPNVLQNTIKEYPPVAAAKAVYEEELGTWIRNGWVVPYNQTKLGPAKALIPLMAIFQRTKSKVRPVLDFRELNTHTDVFTANSGVCTDKLRQWRRQGTDVSMLDLRKAYLQIRVDESLWPYQTVILNGRRYCLTRLGFGLNVAPAIMKAIVDRVHSLAKDVRTGSSAYLDDIFVNESVVTAQAFGLESKALVRVRKGARVLGLQVSKEHDTLQWKRGGELSALPKKLTRRSVFSYCGELVGHYPVCSWLRVATAFVKRQVNSATSRWDEPIRDNMIREHLDELARVVTKNDPVRGRWDAPGNAAKVWVDASALALGIALEMDNDVIEDGTWLRPNDARHINMAELDAVIKGLNVALAWRMKKIELKTDSATVHRWLEDGLSGKTRLRTKAANEMLIQRRIETVLALAREYELTVTVTLVRSMDNKADSLTRVPKRWLAPMEPFREAMCCYR